MHVDNFSSETRGYKKEEVNAFVDYVISKTEENVLIINRQEEEIHYLKNELDRLKRLEDSYNYINNEIRINAEREADLIIKNAKDNASIIVNDALIKAKRLEEERNMALESLKNYKKHAVSNLEKQLELLEDIELL